MKEFVGTYVGISPTDESDVGYGEIEVVVGEDWIRTRHATGLGIDEGEYAVAAFVPMTPEESAEIWNADAPEERKARTVGFRLGDVPRFYFLRNPIMEEFSLFIRVGLGDILGPTLLYNTDQIARGLLEKIVATVEQRYPGDFPRLRNGGKPVRSQ